MLLRRKNAVIYGAGGAVGGAVARTFAREGANVFLAGRRLESIDMVAKEIAADGVEIAQVDALDENAVEQHIDAIAKKVDRIDVVFNAIGFDSRQGTPLLELALEDFSFPIATWTRTQFLTARSAARRMVAKRSGVILMLSASPARMAIPLTGGFGVACAAIEGLSRTLAGELSPQGVRVVCLRPHRISDTLPMDPEIPEMEGESFRELLEGLTLLKRLPTLAEVADTAAFLASDRAGAITGTVANLTCGSSVD
jgi:NAD(P)-dependent dehydrogenase (short-subunit alcohol dehydrogenase family)